MLNLCAASLFFLLIHFGVSGTRLRDALVARLGDGPYRGLFSLASLAGLVWLIHAYRHAPAVPTWGLLLALRPAAYVLVFVAFLLFDRTRGLFDGWLRAAIGFAIAPLAANVFGAAMLVMLAPFLATISDNADAGVFDMSPIITVGLIVAVFALVMGMALRAGAAIAGGFSPRLQPRPCALALKRAFLGRCLGLSCSHHRDRPRCRLFQNH